jgi:alpha-beta hydrolase superfamily lysophospholipase
MIADQSLKFHALAPHPANHLANTRRYPDLFQGLIGLSAAFDVSEILPPWPIMLAVRALAAVSPKLRLRRAFDPRLIVSDPAALADWARDPLVSRERATAAYAAVLAAAAAALAPLVPGIRVRMLMMWGTGDRVVSRKGHERMVRESASPDAELKLYEGALHNILAEPACKDGARADIADWLLRPEPTRV